MTAEKWTDIGAADELRARPVSRLRAGSTELAVSCKDGVFGVLANACNHLGGPLGDGHLDGDYVT